MAESLEPSGLFIGVFGMAVNKCVVFWRISQLNTHRKIHRALFAMISTGKSDSAATERFRANSEVEARLNVEAQ